MDTTPTIGDPDGFGRYGQLEENDAGLTCHDCGWTGRHLGLHLAKAHRDTAAAYQERHGLQRSRGLVAAPTRASIAGNARAGLDRRPRFLERRDPDAATRARLAAGRAASAQEAAVRDSRMRQLGRSRRREVVVTCAQCQVQFCPLVDKRRRFCSRSCASRWNRRPPRSATGRGDHRSMTGRRRPTGES